MISAGIMDFEKNQKENIKCNASEKERKKRNEKIVQPNQYFNEQGKVSSTTKYLKWNF